MTRQQRIDVEFRGGIEAAICHGHFLTQQAIGADDLVFRIALERTVQDQKVIANRVPAIDITLPTHGVGRKLRVHLFDENTIANCLSGIDFARRAGKARF